jgi:hypothetical protein
MKYKVSINVRNKFGLNSEKVLKRCEDKMTAIFYCQDFTGNSKICIEEWNGKRWINQIWFYKGNRI